MNQLQTKLPTDTWVVASWDEYVQVIELAYEKAKGYYYNGQLRIEMSPVGSARASAHHPRVC